MLQSPFSMQKVYLPLAYLPPLDWFMALLSSHEILIDCASYYRKQSYRNRCYILSANGILPLSIPVQADNLQQSLHEVSIDYSKPWCRVHWRAIESAYNRSPFFVYYKDLLAHRFLGPEVPSLCEWNFALIIDILSLLRSEKYPELVHLRQALQEVDVVDLRKAFHPKHTHRFSCSHYQPYRQVFAERFGFLHRVSVLDVLFNLGPEALDYLERHGQNARLL